MNALNINKPLITRCYCLLLIALLSTAFAMAQTPVTFFTDDCSSSTGWTLETATPIPNGDYEVWRIANLPGSCAIDGSTLSIHTWKTATSQWACGYPWSGSYGDIRAYKNVDARGYKNLSLKFDWYCKGEYYTSTTTTVYDYGILGYFTSGTTFIPINTGGTDGLGHYYGSSNITQNAIITLPAALDSSQFKLVFRWIHDSSTGADPGFTIDNISISGAITGAPLLADPDLVFSDNFSSKEGWLLETGTKPDLGNYVSWNINNSPGLCSIDGNSLSVGMWNTDSLKLLCGYRWDGNEEDINASKQVNATGYEGLVLSFDWICKGEYYYSPYGSAYYDYGKVGYSLDGVNFTWINTDGVDGQGRYYNRTTVTRGATVTLPASLNNTRFILAFHWRQDNSYGADPGFTVDNIKITGTKQAVVLSTLFSDNFTAGNNWQLPRANPDAAGNTLGWNIDSRCAINGNSLSINLFNKTLKDWQCGFATTAATDLVAQRTISAVDAKNLLVKFDWQVTSASATDYGQLGYSTNDGQSFTWLTKGGTANTGKYYNQATVVKGAIVPLPAALAGKTFKLGFRWVNDAGTNTGAAFIIDNLSLVSLRETMGAPIVAAVAAPKINKVTIETPKTFGNKTEANVDALNEDNKITQFNYSDGFARAVQNVTVKGSPSKTDLVEPIQYDELGRKSTNYLPYAAGSSNGAYKQDALNEQQTFYTTGKLNFTTTAYPFAKTVFEPSPLNRVMEQGNTAKEFQPNTPGAAIQKQKSYSAIDVTGSNVRNAIKYITLGTGTFAPPLNFDYYSAHNGLSNVWVTETSDADGKITRSYTDKQGKDILVRQYETDGSTLITQTAKVYDDLDRLRYVITPEGMEQINTLPTAVQPDFLDKWCFQYIYDQRGRIISKKVPGGGWLQMAYDRWDRLVVSQDANQLDKTIPEFTYIKYDKQNRVIMTGVLTRSNTATTISDIRAELLDPAKGQRFENRTLNSGRYDYTGNLTYPIPNASNTLDILITNYYDDYNYTDIYTVNFNSALMGGQAQINTSYNNGLLTATAARILGASNSILTVNFYDQYGNTIHVYTVNHTNVTNYIATRYDFEKHPFETLEGISIRYNGTLRNITLKSRSEYDHMGRLKKYFHTSGSQAEILLAAYSYNALGKLAEKNLHSINGGTSFLQSVDYTFNEKGWLTHINNAELSSNTTTNNDNNDLFGLELKYYTPDIGSTTVAGDMLYNGNIAEALWKSSNDSKKKGYKYTYDGLNRLLTASYRVNNGNWSSSNENYRFSLNSITYDKNGNIKTMQTNGPTSGGAYNTMDNLTYTYNANRLLKVDDAITGATDYAYDFQNGANSGDDYSYDDNGNMIQDLNKNISLSYNYLNLPQTVSSLTSGDYISYTYDATGRKLKKEVYTNGVGGSVLSSRTDYVGSVQYLDGYVDFAFTPEGRGKNTAGSNATAAIKYEYTIKDHLGNARLSFAANAGTGLAEIIQVDDYYPHGNTFNSLTPSPRNNYLYNDKEFQSELGFNNLDFGFRLYDPQIGRWHVPDLLADQYRDITPYGYVLNNPINFVDPFGLDVFPVANVVAPNSKTKDFDPAKDQLLLPTVEIGSGNSDNDKGSGETKSDGESTSASNTGNGDSGNDNNGTQAAYTEGGNGGGTGSNFPDEKKNDDLINNTTTGFDYQSTYEDDRWANATQTGVGATDLAWGVKEEIIDYAAKSSPAIEKMKYVKVVKVVSKGLFAAQAGISIYNAGHAFYNNNSNKWGVAGKASLDIAMGVISVWGGPVGWAIGGAYFIADAAGAFDSWGKEVSVNPNKK